MYLNNRKAKIKKELFSIFHLFSSFHLYVSKIKKAIIQMTKKDLMFVTTLH